MMRILRSLVSNIVTLLLSVIAAIVIWGIAVRQADPIDQQLWQIPVQVIGLPADGRLVTISTQSVQAVAQGPTSALADLSTNDFLAFVDLAQAPFGSSEVPVQIELNKEQIEVDSWVPDTVTVELERIISRDIPVNVDIRGNVAGGHRTLQPVVEPAAITVTGPASRVNSLGEARVTVFLDDARETIVVSPRPFFYDVQGAVAGTTNFSLSADVVQVTVPIEEMEGFAQKPITVKWQGTPAPGYRLLNVTVEPDSILVTARPTQLSLLSRLETETIDITGLKETFSQQVTLNLPAGIQLDQPQPIFVTVEIEPILTSSVVTRSPEIRALGPGLTATLDTETVRLFVYGPLETVDSLVEEDVRVTLDLVGLDVGTYTLEPIVSIFANDLELRSIQPPDITVIITEMLTTTNEITSTSVLPASPLPTTYPAAPLPPVSLAAGWLPAANPGAKLRLRHNYDNLCL